MTTNVYVRGNQRNHTHTHTPSGAWSQGQAQGQGQLGNVVLSSVFLHHPN